MFSGSMLLIFCAAVLSACKFVAPEISDSEKVSIYFAQWPPEVYKSEYENNSIYPDLSRWLVEIISAEGISRSYVAEKSFEIEMNKNVPVAVYATPITLNSQGKESKFFKPCGGIYPYDYDDGLMQLSWTGGYTAHIFKNLYESKKETGVTSEHMMTFLTKFNWKKFQAALSEKSAKTPGYNPWLIDTYALLENISYGSFKQNLLDTKNLAALAFSTLGLNYDNSMLSSYVPENKYMRESGKINVIKTSPTLLSYKKDYALIILYTSAKNISLECVFMPIFVEEI